jgi:uncharacterized membrane-anchored protein YitT (DUF2179 family)
MKKSTFLVSSGYAVSIISVVLMGVVAWQAASHRDWLTLALVGGMITSVIGMALRWEAHRLQAEEIENNNKGKH